MKKRIISLILAVSMMISLFPVSVFADTGGGGGITAHAEAALPELTISSSTYRPDITGMTPDAAHVYHGNGWRYVPTVNGIANNDILYLDGDSFDFAGAMIQCHVEISSTTTVQNAIFGRYNNPSGMSTIINNGTLKNCEFYECNITNDSSIQTSEISDSILTNNGTIDNSMFIVDSDESSQTTFTFQGNGQITNSLFTFDPAKHGLTLAVHTITIPTFPDWSGDPCSPELFFVQMLGTSASSILAGSAPSDSYHYYTIGTIALKVTACYDPDYASHTVCSINGIPIASYDPNYTQGSYFTIFDEDITLGVNPTTAPALEMDASTGKPLVIGLTSYSGVYYGDGWTYDGTTLTLKRGSYDFNSTHPQDPASGEELGSVWCAVEVQAGAEVTNGAFSRKVTNYGTMKNISAFADFENYGTVEESAFSNASSTSNVTNVGGTLTNCVFSLAPKGITPYYSLTEVDGAAITLFHPAAVLDNNYTTLYFTGTPTLKIQLTKDNVKKDLTAINGVHLADYDSNAQSDPDTHTYTFKAKAENIVLNQFNYRTALVMNANGLPDTTDVEEKNGVFVGTHWTYDPNGNGTLTLTGWRAKGPDSADILGDGYYDFSDPTLNPYQKPIACDVVLDPTEASITVTYATLDADVTRKGRSFLTFCILKGKVYNDSGNGSIYRSFFDATAIIHNEAQIFSSLFKRGASFDGTVGDVSVCTFEAKPDESSIPTVALSAYDGAEIQAIYGVTLPRAEENDPIIYEYCPGILTGTTLYATTEGVLSVYMKRADGESINSITPDLNWFDGMFIPNPDGWYILYYGTPENLPEALQLVTHDKTLVMDASTGLPNTTAVPYDKTTGLYTGNGWTYEPGPSGNNAKGILTLTSGTYNFYHLKPTVADSDDLPEDPGVACEVYIGENVTVDGGYFSNRVENHGTLNGIFSKDATVDNYGTLTGLYHCSVSNYGTVQAGTFEGNFSNQRGSDGVGTIEGGTFSGNDTLNYGVINGGTFQGGNAVFNGDEGTINGGFFCEGLDRNNKGTVTGGIFANDNALTNAHRVSIGGENSAMTALTVDNKTCSLPGTGLPLLGSDVECKDGVYYGDGWIYSVSDRHSGAMALILQSGDFDFRYTDPATKTAAEDYLVRCPITIQNNAEVTGGRFGNSVQNDGIISGGTYSKAANASASLSNAQTGRIEDGTFELSVNNYGIITDGNFESYVINEYDGTVNGGRFWDSMVNHGTIHNGVFDTAVLNASTGSIDGGIFAAGLDEDSDTTNVTGGIFANNNALTNAHRVSIAGADSCFTDVNGFTPTNGWPEFYTFADTRLTVTADTDLININGWDIGKQYGSHYPNFSIRTTLAFTMPEADALLNTPKHTLTITRGTMYGNAAPSAPAGTELILTADTAGEDETFVRWKLSENLALVKGELTDPTITVRMPDESASAEAVFASTLYTITVKFGLLNGQKGENGEVTAKFKAGEHITLDVDPDEIPQSMAFNGWDIDSDLLSAIQSDTLNEKGEHLEFDIPASLPWGSYTITALHCPAEIAESYEPSTLEKAATIAVGGAAVGIAVWQGVNLGVDLYLTSVLPEGVPMPTNRRALALLLWQEAGKPEIALPALYGDVPAEEPEAQKASRWAVESGLLPAADTDDASRFDPERSVSKADILAAWLKLKKLMK